MKITIKSLGLIGALGGVGGLINGWLCYVEYPTSVREAVGFSWPIIPLGALHGALLAVVSIGMANLFWKRRLFLRLIGLAVSGYLAGWILGIPTEGLDRIIFSAIFGAKVTWNEVIFWPFSGYLTLATFYVPYKYFGLVVS